MGKTPLVELLAPEVKFGWRLPCSRRCEFRLTGSFGSREEATPMRLTTKGRFAVTAMIDLGLREHRGPVTLAGISQRQRISLSYLEQLFAKLRRHQLVESTRGPGGGYRLAKPME